MTVDPAAKNPPSTSITEASEAPRVSVVIVNWNGRDHLEGCLASLAAQTDQGFETIVVDNGSEDGSEAFMRAEFPTVRVVQTGENLGFAGGVNRGIEVACEPWVATLNNDAVAADDWIAILRAAAKNAAADDGMFQSRVMLLQTPDRYNSTGVLLFTDGYAEDRDYKAPFRAGESGDRIFCPTAGAALYRRAMLDAIALPAGVFDPRYFMYFEDLDLGWRAALAGWKCHYLPSAIVLHEMQGTSRRRGPTFVQAQCCKNRILTLIKNGSPQFIAKTAVHSVRDLFRVAGWQGVAVLPVLARSARQALHDRKHVEAMRRVDRREIERRWVTARTR